jgi:hypothetical protein
MKFLENPEGSLKFYLCKVSISGDWTDLTFRSVNTAFCKMSLCPHTVSSYSSKFCFDNSPHWLQLSWIYLHFNTTFYAWTFYSSTIKTSTAVECGDISGIYISKAFVKLSMKTSDSHVVMEIVTQVDHNLE